ncbi:hypothetical protein [Vibrio owensii]|uniref:hypothetical protein n=1 Tax=Vibrio owensii TaxID=696485 RepID=UPI00406808A4
MIIFDFINPNEMKRTEVVIMFSKNECRISVTNVCAMHSFTLHGDFQFITAIKAALNSMTKKRYMTAVMELRWVNMSYSIAYGNPLSKKWKNEWYMMLRLRLILMTFVHTRLC